MAKWLKFYAIHKFSTSPDSYQRTTLLNTDVPIFHITLKFLQLDGCQSEWGILSRQPSCPEATARHTSDIRGRVFFIFQQDGAPAHRARDTVSFLERDTPDFIPPTLWPPNSPDLNPV